MAIQETSKQHIYTGNELTILEKVIQFLENIPIAGIPISGLSILLETVGNDLPCRFLKYFENKRVSYFEKMTVRTTEQENALQAAQQKVDYYTNCILRANKLRRNSFLRIPLLSTAYHTYLFTTHMEEMEHKVNAAEEKMGKLAKQIEELFTKIFEKARDTLIEHFKQDKEKIEKDVKFVVEKWNTIETTVSNQFEKAKESFLNTLKNGGSTLHEDIVLAHKKIELLETSMKQQYEIVKKETAEEAKEAFNLFKKEILENVNEWKLIATNFEETFLEKLNPRIKQLNELITDPDKMVDLNKIQKLKEDFAKKLKELEDNALDEEQQAHEAFEKSIKTVSETVNEHLKTLSELMEKFKNNELVSIFESCKKEFIEKFEDFENKITKKVGTHTITVTQQKKKTDVLEKKHDDIIQHINAIQENHKEIIKQNQILNNNNKVIVGTLKRLENNKDQKNTSTKDQKNKNNIKNGYVSE